MLAILSSPYEQCTGFIERGHLPEALKIIENNVEIKYLADKCFKKISETCSKNEEFLGADRFIKFSKEQADRYQLLSEFFNKFKTVPTTETISRLCSKIHKAMQAHSKTIQTLSNAEKTDSEIQHANSETGLAIAETRQALRELKQAEEALRELEQDRLEDLQTICKIYPPLTEAPPPIYKAEQPLPIPEKDPSKCCVVL